LIAAHRHDLTTVAGFGDFDGSFADDLDPPVVTQEVRRTPDEGAMNPRPGTRS
jgi:hypothetical protein